MQTQRLGSPDGVRLELVEYGATVHRLLVPTATGPRNVVLGHRTREEYVAGSAFHGATIGRFANRIAGGRFALDGTTYRLDVNDRGNTLHGGSGGFDTRDWTLESLTGSSATLSLVSPDGDQGFPGAVQAAVTYTVDGASVSVELTATTDAPTPVSLTNHSYLNLAGEGSGSVDEHLLTVHADHYTPTDATSIPTGEVAPVDGTPFDLRTPTRVGEAVRREHPQLRLAQGIDHNLVVAGTGMRDLAEVRTADLAMVLASDSPALQVYTGNFLDGSVTGTGGRVYRQGDGLALEPQAFPDSPNRAAFGSVVLRPGETYRRLIRWTFSDA